MEIELIIYDYHVELFERADGGYEYNVYRTRRALERGGSILDGGIIEVNSLEEAIRYLNNELKDL